MVGLQEAARALTEAQGGQLALCLASLVLAYLLGSVSFAVVVSRALGLSDPRSYGSGNPGATNVLRSGHRGAAVLTLLGDAAKGVLAVLLVRAYVTGQGLPQAWPVWAGLAAFLGHLYPVFHGFRGGKGVATAAGVLFAIAPALGAATLLTWLAVVAVSRYVSLAGVVAALLAPVLGLWAGLQGMTLWPVLAMSGLLIWRHRGNLVKLWAGQEHRLGQRASA